MGSAPPLLEVAAALERMLAEFDVLGLHEIPLAASVGQVLAAPILSPTDLPPFANSSMDGFAVCAADVQQAAAAHPVRLRVGGNVRAGEQDLPSMGRGEALRIATGAPLPTGADAVVPVELTTDPRPMSGSALPDEVLITSPVQPGDYIRQSGQDVRAGALVFEAGRRLRPADVGMLAALGVANPRVHRQPRVAVVSTGDEVLEPEQPLTPGKIRDSNGYALLAAARAAGGIPLRLGIAPDHPQKLGQILDQALESGADLLVSSAGVSMGVFDLVRQAVEAHGTVAFWRVNIRPGKPLLFGRYKGVPLFGLPGNPVSALVTFEIFVRPAIERMSGLRQSSRQVVEAVLDEPLRSDGRQSYLRAKVQWKDGTYHASLTGTQDSGVLSSLLLANALIIVPAGVKMLQTGEVVETWLLQ